MAGGSHMGHGGHLDLYRGAGKVERTVPSVSNGAAILIL